MQLPGFGDTSNLQTYTALPPLVFEDSEYLFLMTMPSFDSEARKFYFADTGNHFWKVMAAIYKMPAETSEERTALCKANKIAIWSVLKSCKRHLSQQDTTTDEVYNDMAGFLKEHPTIKKLICVSRMAESGPGSAGELVLIPEAVTAACLVAYSDVRKPDRF